MDCPKCGFEAARGATECARCGIIFAKATRVPASTRRPSPVTSSDDPEEPEEPRGTRGTREFPPPYVIEEERVEDGRVGPAEWKIMGFGLAAAIVVYAIPFTRFVFSAMVTLFHELGHAVMGWILGHASLPAFDIVYGGGLTHYGIFRRSIAIAVALGFAYLLYLFRHNRKSVAIVGAMFLLWLFFVTREWRREVAMAAAGHLAEFILAGIMFYKALAGVGWRSPEFERPLGAFIAFFVQIHSTLFAWRLTHDAAFLSWYREGKGGALMNDLESVALDLHIWLGWSTSIEGVARWLLVFSVLPTVVALVWYFERARWHRVLRSLRTVDA